jgi:hypothetical protein
MHTSVYTGLNPFKFIRKHFLQICDEVKVCLENFQHIAPALNRCIYCLLERRIQHEKQFPQLKEPQWVKTINLPILHFNRCLTTEYSETTAHFNSNFDIDNPIYVPYPKCTATFRKQGRINRQEVSLQLVIGCVGKYVTPIQRRPIC